MLHLYKIFQQRGDKFQEVEKRTKAKNFRVSNYGRNPFFH